MKTVISAVTVGVLSVAAIVGTAHADALTKMSGCEVTKSRAAYRDLTESMQQDRYTVLGADQATGRVVLRAASGFVYDLSCHGAMPVSDEGPVRIGALLPGDIVCVHAPGTLTVVRRPWDEAGSPEH